MVFYAGPMRWFGGEVVAVCEAEELYAVRYDDWDRCQLTGVEVRAAIAAGERGGFDACGREGAVGGD
jgi:hypothetical protein